MKAVSNTSPVNYLIQVGQVELVHELYGQLIVPDSVLRELQHARSPIAVRNWAARPPEWVEVCTPARKADTRAAHLGAGEIGAILLAEEIGADVLIMDERAGIRGGEESRIARDGHSGCVGQGRCAGVA